MSRRKNKKCITAEQEKMRKAQDKQNQQSQGALKQPDQKTLKEEVSGNSHYKDTVFRMLFKDKKRLLGLYNAVSGKHYTDPEELKIVTMESSTYIGMKNDLAFLIDFGLYLFEHQSTINQNMPLRFLLYVASEYSRLTERKKLYEEKTAKIEAPHFVVFYNGRKACAECQELKLSDAFQNQEEKPELELVVKVLNINEGFNEALKEQCRTLGEYMQYVDKVRKFAEVMPVSEAVDKAVDECIEEGILKDFLQKERAAVKRMSLLEYDMELALEIAGESGEAKGLIKGEAKGDRRGSARTLVKDICNLMKNFQISLPEACKGLGYTIEEYENAKKLINGGDKENE